ncbi:C-Jun-amino-terminal kinase-interacting protein 4 [Tachysurus vachellii]|uniref:C-Jun-amino-terminal kinase-interacting protein 4 n=1 Tax=Tachysurus vachellii TaxID=175792 RepID=UPI00296AB813|nr:C-Jun-amino-terminal kinase-interacting protein 4 [Tachysurus vachellii]
MEYGETSLSGVGDLELDPDIVSEEAGKLYSELQSVVETHGADVVESLLPILVWVLEGLASCRAQLRESEEAVEREKGERAELLERYERERTLRRESQERYLELDDQFEQERRAMRGRDKEREKRERDLEKKAREQADQVVALEEQRASLGRELNTLKHTHSKLVLTYRDLLEKKKELEREGSPLRNHIRSKSTEPPEENAAIQHEVPPEDSNAHVSETSASTDTKGIKTETINNSFFISDIISSTPELAQLQGLIEASTPLRAEGGEPNCSLEEEIRPIKEERGEDEEESNQEDEKADKEKDLDSLEWEMRNTDSVFSELSELSQEYVESVDHGVSVRGSTVQFEEILSQYEELKHTHEMVDAARKALIARVEELTNERSSLNLELTSCQETINRLESKAKEMDEEIKRLHKELKASQAEDSDASLPNSHRRFSRSEMARVVMEKNQYKERLIELQDVLRRTQAHGVTKNEKIPEDRKSSVWKRFNRFLGLSKDQLAPAALAPAAFAPAALALTVPSVPSPTSSPVASPHNPHLVSVIQTEDSLSPRLRRRELYREIRSHVWGNLGKRQVHGWSVPLSQTGTQNIDPLLEPKDVPVLTQLRLLDQRDASAKLTCAVAVPPEVSGEQNCSVWAITGPASSSDVTVIDPARSNTILDQFSLPPTSPALCICAVPPTGETSGTVWIGTQDGGVLVHPASGSRRRCMQSVSLSEGVHSLTFSPGQVIAGLGNGMLAFFSYSSGGWNLHSHEVLSLGITPLQPIRCCLAKSGCLWVGYWNKVLMIDVQKREVTKSFTVSQRSEQQVRFLCAAGSGVWASCRLDPTLRLFDWTTGRPLQEADVSSVITKALGNAFLSLSPLQISALSVVSGRLWVGTGSGAVFSIPLTLGSESSIPYCTLSLAQLCFHGHRQAVKFIISAPGCRGTSVSADGAASTSHLILSGGEGYINFRIGDEVSDGLGENVPQRSERSHVIIWQSPTQSVPSSSL